MARPLRIQYAGAVYHVTCRGNEQKDIFKDDDDRKKMLEILTRSLNIYTVKLFSYVLMNNHFHLLVETPLGNLAEFMRHFNIAYTGYYNRRHGRSGHLYQGRYKSILVDKEAYLSILSRYIHLNPVRIKAMSRVLIEKKVRILERYPWSSLQGYLTKGKKEPFIGYAMVLDEYGGDTDRARKGYKDALYTELSDGMEIKDKILGQSILGRDEFVKWVRKRFIDKGKSKELPAVKEIHRYCSQDSILRIIKEETGKILDDLREEKGVYRQIAMDLLYRLGGLKGEEIGRLFGVGYTSVSQERRRLGERLQQDRKLRGLLNRIKGICE